MKCSKCGQEYQGNFCPKCGAPAPGNAAPAPHKKKKFRWWYVLIALVLIGVIGSAMGGNEEDPSTEDNQIQGEISQPEETPDPVEDSEPTESEPEESEGWTVEQQNAMATAKDYLDYSGFSYNRLISQLEYEGYSTELATWAADNCNADWDAEALESAKDYLDYSAFSYNGLINQLEYEEFTTEQATYAADNCGADWNAEAAECAKSYLDFSSFSRDGLIDQLEYEGFTYEQAVYGVEQNGM